MDIIHGLLKLDPKKRIPCKYLLDRLNKGTEWIDDNSILFNYICILLNLRAVNNKDVFNVIRLFLILIQFSSITLFII